MTHECSACILKFKCYPSIDIHTQENISGSCIAIGVSLPELELCLVWVFVFNPGFREIILSHIKLWDLKNLDLLLLLKTNIENSNFVKKSH